MADTVTWVGSACWSKGRSSRSSSRRVRARADSSRRSPGRCSTSAARTRRTASSARAPCAAGTPVAGRRPLRPTCGAGGGCGAAPARSCHPRCPRVPGASQRVLQAGLAHGAHRADRLRLFGFLVRDGVEDVWIDALAGCVLAPGGTHGNVTSCVLSGLLFELPSRYAGDQGKYGPATKSGRTDSMTHLGLRCPQGGSGPRAADLGSSPPPSPIPL